MSKIGLDIFKIGSKILKKANIESKMPKKSGSHPKDPTHNNKCMTYLKNSTADP